MKRISHLLFSALVASVSCAGSQSTGETPPASGTPTISDDSSESTPSPLVVDVWNRQQLGNFPLFSVEVPAPLVEDYEDLWMREYTGPGANYTLTQGDVRFGARASRPHGSGARGVETWLALRSEAGCIVEEGTADPSLPHSPHPVSAVRQWSATCDGVEAVIRHYEFESEIHRPGRGITLIVVGASSEVSTRFFESVRAASDQEWEH